MGLPESIEHITPLTPLQSGILAHCIGAQDSSAYVEQIVLAYDGPLNQSAYEKTWADMIARHTALRTCFAWENLDAPFQVIKAKKSCKTPVVFLDLDTKHPDQAEREQAFQAIVTQEREDGFVLSTAPLFRIKVVRFASDQYRIVLTIHHIINDGWSVGVMMRDASRLYQGHLTGVPAVLPKAAPFHNYSEWLNARGQDEAVAYWTDRLSRLDGDPSLPTYYGTSDQKSCEVASNAVSHIFDHEVSAKIQAFARENGVTVGSFFHATLALVLSRLAGRETVCFGSVLSTRPDEVAGADNMVGLMLNTVPVVATVPTQTTVGAFLQETQRQLLLERAHGDLPLKQIIGLRSDSANQELFDCLLVFEGLPMRDATEEQGVSVRQISSFDKTNYPLTLMVLPGDQITIKALYDGETVDQAFAELILRCIETVSTGFIADKDAQISKIQLLGPSEQDTMLTRSLGPVTWTEQQPLEPFLTVLQEQVKKAPATSAIRLGDRRWNYGELAAHINALSQTLIENGVQPGDIVGVYFHRSPEQIAAILAVLAVGGCVLPMDAGYAQSRLEASVHEAAPKLVLVADDVDADWLLQKNQAICIWPLGHQRGSENLHIHHAADQEDGAYLLYTSGSTGRPKGVMVPHRLLTNLISAVRADVGVEPTDKVLQYASTNFDVSFIEMAIALPFGAELVLVDDETRIDPDALTQVMITNGVTIAPVPPAMAGLLDPAQLPDVTCVVVSGEACPAEVATKWAKTTRFVNMYGPTETGYVTSAEYENGDVSRDIGSPIPNTAAFIVDRHGQLLPNGIAGELLIAGRTLALGYKDRPDLTDEKFIQTPFPSPDGLTKTYRTGDIAWRGQDGYIRYLGRRDDQIQIHGHRVELTEIQSILEQHQAVLQAVVLPVNLSASNDIRLHAFLKTAIKFDDTVQESIKRHLTKHLPVWMIPSVFHAVLDWPLNSNGKIDRKQLTHLAAQEGQTHSAEVTLPQGDFASGFFELWQSLIGPHSRSFNEDFFELGGDSIIAAKLALAIRKTYWPDYPMNGVYRHSKCHQLCAFVFASMGDGASGSSEDDKAAGSFDLMDDARLRSDFMIRPSASRGTRKPENVFITGGTGFVGAHLVEAFLKATPGTIFCHARAKSDADAKARITSALQKYGVWRDDYQERLIGLSGDLSQPRLGLSNENWDMLKSNIGSVIHCGAHVDFAHPYENLRKVNVCSLDDLLELSALGVELHHISTFGVVDHALRDTAGSQKPKHIHEGSDLSHWRGLVGGYNQSKWAADYKMRAAIDQGAPVSVYRLANVSGSRISGINHQSDLIWKLCRAFIETGSMPDISMQISLTPVDEVANAVAKLAQPGGKNLGQVWHLGNTPKKWRDYLPMFSEAGYDLSLVSAEEWGQIIQDRLTKIEDQNLMSLLPVIDGASGLFEPIPITSNQTQKVLCDLRGEISNPDANLFQKYLMWFQENGFFPKSEKCFASVV